MHASYKTHTIWTKNKNCLNVYFFFTTRPCVEQNAWSSEKEPDSIFSFGLTPVWTECLGWLEDPSDSRLEQVGVCLPFPPYYRLVQTMQSSASAIVWLQVKPHPVNKIKVKFKQTRPEGWNPTWFHLVQFLLQISCSADFVLQTSEQSTLTTNL